METLQVLQQRITQLISLVKELKDNNDALIKEKALLLKKIESLESSLLKGKENLEEEKAVTKMAVDELIKNIDGLVDSNNETRS